MVSHSEVEFTQISRQLAAYSRRDIAQGIKLVKFKKSAGAMVKKDPVAGNTLLGLIACLEHDLASMHACHKKAVELSDSCFSLMYYAVSLERSCLWNEAARYTLFALDHEPENLKLLNAAIALAPLTGRFSLLKRLLAQREKAVNTEPHPSSGHHIVVSEILSRHGLQEKDLKETITAIGDALSETDVILAKFCYDFGLEGGRPSFVHYRFVVPDQFVASYYEDLIAQKLNAAPIHPRIFDVFSYSVENSTVYQLYNYMEKELEFSADTIKVPDPEKIKLIEELIEGVEV